MEEIFKLFNPREVSAFGILLLLLYLVVKTVRSVAPFLAEQSKLLVAKTVAVLNTTEQSSLRNADNLEHLTSNLEQLAAMHMQVSKTTERCSQIHGQHLTNLDTKLTRIVELQGFHHEQLSTTLEHIVEVQNHHQDKLQTLSGQMDGVTVRLDDIHGVVVRQHDKDEDEAQGGQ